MQHSFLSIHYIETRTRSELHFEALPPSYQYLKGIHCWLTPLHLYTNTFCLLCYCDTTTMETCGKQREGKNEDMEETSLRGRKIQYCRVQCSVWSLGGIARLLFFAPLLSPEGMGFSASRWIIRLLVERARDLFILISPERACPSSSDIIEMTKDSKKINSHCLHSVVSSQRHHTVFPSPHTHAP